MRSPEMIFVSGEPKGQPRPRATIRGKHAGMYDPGTAKEWKKAVAREWQLLNCEPFYCAVSVNLTFFMPRPKAHWRASMSIKGLKPSAPKHHAQKPDVDNLAKAVLDALTDAGAWADDKLVVDLRVSKQWSVGEGGCEITIKEAFVRP